MEDRRVMEDRSVSGSTWPWTDNFAVPSGTHTLKWKYYKYSRLDWLGLIRRHPVVTACRNRAAGRPGAITAHDPPGRRIAKDVDGEVMKAAGGPRPTLRLGCALDAGQALSWAGSREMRREHMRREVWSIRRCAPTAAAACDVPPFIRPHDSADAYRWTIRSWEVFT